LTGYLIRGDIVTMSESDEIVTSGAVAIIGSTIVAVGPFDQLHAQHRDLPVVGNGDDIVTPGYINAHQHLTGDRLVQSCIPDTIDSQAAIYQWAVPVHTHHSGDDDELSATLGAVNALRHGITCTIEAGTVAHPDRVATALEKVGIRGTLGQWGWDVTGLPFAAATDEVLERQRTLIERYPPGQLVEAWVTLVGHDLMSDELVSGASALARQLGVGLTFHMSPHRGDARSYLERTGRRPLVHLQALGVLGSHVLIAHGVHLDGAEVEAMLTTDTALVSCPWAYLRLAQGFVGAHRHDELLRRGGRVALGCDAENAGDAVDILRAASLFVGLCRDRAEDPFSFSASTALAMATIGGAKAIGKGATIGSLEVGKQADVVVHSTRGPQFVPRSTDPVRQLMWASDGRSVSDVWVAGRQLIAHGECITVDLDGLRHEAQQRRDFLLAQRS
jgi:5-methylthioadenosine/S-adenosylhomocysteine deaminase